mmetsp:Transcript_12837/g.29294  ORF Transcript_12837/g.29294 Transcript_12837/m.29294 type:complete len:341 (-) Transcript_12837:130-1152(-)
MRGLGIHKACSHFLLLLPLLLPPTAGIGASQGHGQGQAASTSSPLTEQPVSVSSTATSGCISDNIMSRHEQDGEEARQIAQYLPYFPFKGIPRFYDIGGFLAEPEVFQRIVDIFVARYAEIGIDSVAGLDARGFILGPPIALALKKPFIMMRKEGKMPNTISSSAYNTEYGKRAGLTVQKDRIKKGDRVLVIDDLVATGGTLSSAINLVHALGGTVVECACVVELKMFIDPTEESGLPSRTRLFKEQGIEGVPVWGLISEDVLRTRRSFRRDTSTTARSTEWGNRDGSLDKKVAACVEGGVPERCGPRQSGDRSEQGETKTTRRHEESLVKRNAACVCPD